MSGGFDTGAGITVIQVSCNSLSHPRPLVIAANKFIGGGTTRVTSCRVIMMGMNYCLIEGFVVWDAPEAIYVH